MTRPPILRTSERRSFKRCQAQWWWGYREGLKPKGFEATPLWFGTGFHLCLADWYLPGLKRGAHPSETWEKYGTSALAAIKADPKALEEKVTEYEDGVALGRVLTEEYVKRYGNDRQWRFIAPEQRFSLDVPWPKDRQTVFEVDPDSGELLVEYDGTFDGVYEDLETGRIELLETKTARSIQTGHLPLDDQAGSYWAVATFVLRKDGLIRPDQKISGINYNFVRKGLPDDRPKDAEGYATNKPKKEDYVAALARYASQLPPQLLKFTTAQLQAEAEFHGLTVLGERSKVQPPPLFERFMVVRTSAEQRTQLRRIQDEAVQMELLRQGMVQPTKNPGDACRWCQFAGMCELQERQGNWEDHKKVFFKIEDPYKDHRKSSDE